MPWHSKASRWWCISVLQRPALNSQLSTKFHPYISLTVDNFPEKFLKFVPEILWVPCRDWFLKIRNELTNELHEIVRNKWRYDSELIFFFCNSTRKLSPGLAFNSWFHCDDISRTLVAIVETPEQNGRYDFNSTRGRSARQHAHRCVSEYCAFWILWIWWFLPVCSAPEL